MFRNHIFNIKGLGIKYVVPSISFRTFFVQPFKIVIDSGKFCMFLLQEQLEYTLLKPDCHSWWILKMHSGREDTLEERYAIKFCFKLGKMPQKHMECFRLLFNHLAWIEHQFLSGIRDSTKVGSPWRMMRGEGGVRKSIHQSWLSKGLGLRLLCWGFKGVQEEIPREEASTLQIGSMAFPPGQSTSPQLHPCHVIWPRWASRQFLSLSIVQTLLPVTFAYSLSSEAVVMRQLRRWKVDMPWNPTPTNQPTNHLKIKLPTGWNDKIVALEKVIWFHFHLMKTGFLFLLQMIY